MATATRFTRSAVVGRLLELIGDARAADPSAVPADTIVRRGLPRDPLAGAVIGLGDIEFVETAVPTLKTGRRHYDDRYRLEVLCIAWQAGADTFTVVDERAEDCAELVRSVLADHPQLDRAGTGLAGVVSATIVQADGPNPWHTADGVGSAVRMFLELDTRITEGVAP